MLRGLRSPSRPVLLVCGSLVLITLAGCGRNYFFSEREPWRREAEVACMKSGTVRESQVVIRSEPINGPGMCGADFPLKVAALGESMPMGYAEGLRPPGAIPGASAPQPKWPIAGESYEPRPARTPAPVSAPPAQTWRNGKPVPTVDPSYSRHYPPAGEAASSPIPLTPQGARSYETPLAAPARDAGRRRSVFDAPKGPARENEEEDEFAYRPTPQDRAARPQYTPVQPQRSAAIPLGTRTPYTGSVVPVEIKPAATLACPIVSALDRWIADAIQPAAQRWFGMPVAEIRQISAYSCRGMNGQPGARISEHAFGNALDISSFILADGRRITVKDGWRGSPEEQGFLRDIQGAACEQFTTVLAPGSNRFHYDHIHVDLMRRPSGRSICNPDAVSGEEVATRVAKERGYALRRDPGITGSIGAAKKTAEKPKAGPKPKKFLAPQDDDDWVEDDGPRERDD